MNKAIFAAALAVVGWVTGCRSEVTTSDSTSGEEGTSENGGAGGSGEGESKGGAETKSTGAAGDGEMGGSSGADAAGGAGANSDAGGSGASDGGGGAGIDSMSPESSVPCGDMECSGASPICCWDPGNQTGFCSASATACSMDALGCVSGADCGGAQCCAGAMRSLCLPSCADAEMLVFCADVSECPPVAGKTASCEATEDPSLPFATGYCWYTL